MDRLIKINGKSYKAADFDVNLICEMEDKGIELDDISKKMFSTIRMYVALSMGVDVATAGKEITEHLKNGGSLEDVSEAMADMMSESGFFRTEQKNKDQTSSKRTRAKKTEESEIETEVIS